MSSIKLTPNASGSGAFTIAAPNSNNNRTMTLADSDGTIYIAPGNGIQALAAGVPTARTITAGTGITVTNGDGSAGNPTIANAGVTSVTGGTGISASASTGGVTLTNTGVTSVAAGTGISVSASTGGVTITSTVSGGVTSVATGNGLQGGTITSTGTLSLAAPTQNTVGSYAMVFTTSNNTGSNPVFGTNYSAGSGTLQMQAGTMIATNCFPSALGVTGVQISGTWRWMAGTGNSQGGVGYQYLGIAVRVA